MVNFSGSRCLYFKTLPKTSSMPQSNQSFFARKNGKSVRTLLAVFSLFFYFSCKTVAVPSKEKDKAPEISITVSDKARNTSQAYTSDQTITVSKGTTNQFIISAYNDVGGVKDLFVTVLDRNIKLDVHNPPPDASGKVNKQLYIAFDKTNNPITDSYLDPGRTYSVSAEAVNYNGMVSDVVLHFVVPPDPPSLTINDFQVEPGVGVYPGENFTISWKYLKQVDNSAVDLLVTKQYYQEPELPVIQVLDAPLNGLTSAPSGLSGFPKFRMTVRFRNNPSISSTSGWLTRHVQQAQGTPVLAAFLSIYGPNTNPFMLVEKTPFSVSYTFANPGSKELDAFDVNLMIDNVKEGDTKSVHTLQPNEAVTLQWDVTKELTAGFRSFDLIRVSNSGNLGHSQLLFNSK
jgi:hypothetical protein